MMKFDGEPCRGDQRSGQELQPQLRSRAQVAAIIDRAEQASQGRGRNQRPAKPDQVGLPESIQEQGRDQARDQGEVDRHAAQERHGAGMEPPFRIGIGQHAEPPRQAPHQGCQRQRRSQGRGHRNQQVEPIAIHSDQARRPCRALPRFQLRGLSSLPFPPLRRTNTCSFSQPPGKVLRSTVSNPRDAT